MKYLLDKIKQYVEILNDYCPAIGTHFESIPRFQATLLDILISNRKLVKSVYYLLNNNDDKNTDVPIYIICRSITANCLAIYYFTAFFNINDELDNDAITSELTAIYNLEYIPYLNKITPLQYEALQVPSPHIPVPLHKKWIEYHSKTDSFILEPLKKVRGQTLTEETKYKFALSKHSKARHDYIKNTYILYKALSQYYHYNIVGGEGGRKFSKKNVTNHCAYALLSSMDTIALCMRPLNNILSYEETWKALSEIAKDINEIIMENADIPIKSYT